MTYTNNSKRERVLGWSNSSMIINLCIFYRGLELQYGKLRKSQCDKRCRAIRGHYRYKLTGRLRSLGEQCQLHKVGSDHVGRYNLMWKQCALSNKGTRCLITLDVFKHNDGNLCSSKTGSINYLVTFPPNYFKCYSITICIIFPIRTRKAINLGYWPYFVSHTILPLVVFSYFL